MKARLKYISGMGLGIASVAVGEGMRTTTNAATIWAWFILSMAIFLCGVVLVGAGIAEEEEAKREKRLKKVVRNHAR